MRVSRSAWRILVIGSLVVAAIILWWRDETHPAQTAEVAETPPLRDAARGVVVPKEKNAAPSREQEIQPPKPGGDYAAQLRDAPDYLEYVRELLPAARAGDHAAQLYVFRALDYCAVEYRVRIDPRGVHRTLDDALRTAATRWPYDSEAVRLIYSRCHTLVESDPKVLGERGEWLKLASDGGHPLAQAIASHTKIASSPNTHSDDVANSEEGRRLLGLAIPSRDPEVLWEIGGFGLAPKSGDDLTVPENAWFLAACQRGLDCSPRSDAVRTLCIYDSNCQPYEAVSDVLRRGTADEYSDLEARASWINEKIDAGDWAALGF